MSLPTAEQFAIAGRIAGKLRRGLPKTGVMSAEDVNAMADEALIELVAAGKAPSEPSHLGIAVRNKMIDRLRTEGVLKRDRKKGTYERPESPGEPSMIDERHALGRGAEQILKLTFEHDMTPSMIAEMTGRTVAGIYAQKGTALRSLRGLMLPRALEALAESANGLSAAETGVSMGISTETVKYYRKQAIRALGARNTCHAVALAFKQGLLS